VSKHDIATIETRPKTPAKPVPITVDLISYLLQPYWAATHYISVPA